MDNLLLDLGDQPLVNNLCKNRSQSLSIEKFPLRAKYNDDLLIEETITYVVQINGKKRALIESNKDISEDNLLKLISDNSNLKKYLDNKAIKRKIFVPGKLINIIV